MIDKEERDTTEVLWYYASLVQKKKYVVSESHLEYSFDLKYLHINFIVALLRVCG